jgi:hypothetical protein
MFFVPGTTRAEGEDNMAKKKNFDTKAEALEHIRNSIPKLTSNSANNYRSEDFNDSLKAVLKAICDSKTKGQVKKAMANLTKEGFNGGPAYYSSSWSNGTDKLIDVMSMDRYGGEEIKFSERPFVSIGGKETHVLELNESLDQSDWSELACDTGSNMLDELIYEYSVTVGDQATARKIASRFVELNEGRGPEMLSDRIEDYEPFMAVIKAKRIPTSQRWVSATATNYMRAFYAANRPAPQGLNDRMMSEYREYFKAAKFTKFGLEAKRGNSDTNSVIDDFDILESNSTARKELFTQSSYELNRKLRNMAEKDEARLARIATKHLNAEHPNGVRKSTFLRTYRRIADVVKIDPMELNTKLQSYVLLEEIN